MSDLVGCRVGDYQVLRRLGSGGMADVYAARHLQLHRDVALKILRDDHRGSPEDLKRFRREAQAAAQLNHPAIVQVYEIGSADGHHFIAQELVDGSNLSQWLQRSGQLDAGSAINVLQRVAEALRVAHGAGITHRDIKPENIMRAEDGTIKVTDFGLARILSSVDTSTSNLTQAGFTLGTPRYMSPEQIQGHQVDGRSDLYSLGVTMYHLLAGSPPFDAEEPLAMAVKHLHDTPPPLDRIRGGADLPAWLVALIMQLLRKSPEARLQSADEILEILCQHVGTEFLPDGETGGDTSNSQTNDQAHSETTKQADAVAVPASTVANTALGATSATIQLQRVTDAISQTRKRSRRRWPTWLAVGLLGGFTGLAAVVAARPPTVGGLLQGATVARADSIQDQFLTAMTRNDVAGWRAVIDYFPLDASSPQARIKADYHDKARLQLARLMIQSRRLDEAEQAIEAMSVDHAPSPLHQALAITLQLEIAELRQDSASLPRLQEQLRQLLLGIEQENPVALEIFKEVVPEPRRRAWGLLQ